MSSPIGLLALFLLLNHHQAVAMSIQHKVAIMAGEYRGIVMCSHVFLIYF